MSWLKSPLAHKILAVVRRAFSAFAVAFIAAFVAPFAAGNGLGSLNLKTLAVQAAIAGAAAVVALAQGAISQWLGGTPQLAASVRHVVKGRPVAAGKRLGKAAPSNKPKTLRFGAYTLRMSRAPKTCDWSGKVAGWGMALNDQLGCCTI